MLKTQKGFFQTMEIANNNENRQKIPQLFMVYNEQLPYWKNIQKAMTTEGFHSKIFDQTTKEVLYRILNQKVLCCDCGMEITFTIPLTTTELRDFLVMFINPTTGWTCNDCYEKSKHDGRILAEESEKQ